MGGSSRHKTYWLLNIYVLGCRAKVKGVSKGRVVED